MDCPKCGSPMDKSVKDSKTSYTCFCCNDKIESWSNYDPNYAELCRFSKFKIAYFQYVLRKSGTVHLVIFFLISLIVAAISLLLGIIRCRSGLEPSSSNASLNTLFTLGGFTPINQCSGRRSRL